MRILLVEDDDLLAEALVKPSLTNAMSSMLPLMAKRVGNSWKLLHLTCLLDVMLPKLNGIKLCQQLRRIGNRIPILLLTA